MYPFLKKIFQKYYAFWIKFLNLENKTKILSIDFKKKWSKIITNQKKLLIISLSLEVITQIFYSLVPLLIGFIIEQKKYVYFYALSSAWIFVILCSFLSSYFAAILQVQCINSVQYEAFQFFLKVDPIYHAQRESGKLFAKIERAARSYEDFLDRIQWDIIPIIVGITTVTFSFFWISSNLAFIAFFCLLVIAFLNIGLNLLHTYSFEENLIKADDAVKIVSVESLTQVQLIRSYFASNSIANQAKNTSKQLMFKEGTSWIVFSGTNLTTNFAYFLSIFFLGLYILYLIKSNYISITLGTTLILTYLRGTHEVTRVGNRIRKLLRSTTRINDLFNFIRSFGKQTYPVLATDDHIEEIVENARSLNYIHLKVTDLHFDYNPKAQIFEDHSLDLNIPRSQKNKLYGIIGPSGIGKTTLISILGGQLKPSQGIVTLNNISIYDIDDLGRKKLIAMQGQIASTLSGTIRKNLLLGLPKNKLLNDEEMTKILKEVGIWNIFEEKEGLNTIIGEGGLTLSGGQRQRLNFASLYLRAQYFRPLLILIDEPTSSLDEVSERAITEMIKKLSHHALTLVIAHRIKTLEDAVALLDFSLIEQERELTFYKKDELYQKSIYYRKLIEGHINLEY